MKRGLKVSWPHTSQRLVSALKYAGKSLSTSEIQCCSSHCRVYSGQPTPGFPWTILSVPLTPCHSLGLRVVLSPDPFELVQVMGPKDGPVAGEVVKVVHDDGHKEVNDLRAEEQA